MPTTDDELVEGMGMVEPFPTAEIADADLRRYLREWDAVLAFHERRGRWPRLPGELPPSE